MFVDLVPSRVTSAVTFDSTSEPWNFPVGLSTHPAPTEMPITCDGKKHTVTFLPMADLASSWLHQPVILN